MVSYGFSIISGKVNSRNIYEWNAGMKHTLKHLVAVKDWFSLALLAQQQREQARLCDSQQALLWFFSL